jgi:outer membrane protein OmpA-like peptidoglycan-associated protein
MALSQGRSRAVLQRCLGLVTASDEREWARRYITANGLSSSRLVFADDGSEDLARSRRVEFRTVTAAERRVVQILETLNQ